MTAIVRWNGTWNTAASGVIRVRWAGAWQVPSRAYVHWNGGWNDTGYQGYPGQAGTPYVSSWDYSNVNASWSAPGSGASVSAYQVVLTNNVGTWLAQAEGAFSSFNFGGLAQDTQYQVYVRAKGASGLYGAFSNPLRIAIGHASTVTTTYPSRYWASNTWSGTIFRNEAPIVLVPDQPGTGGNPAGVNAVAYHCHISTPNSGNLDNGSTREFHIVNANVVSTRLTNQASPYNIDNPYGVQAPAFGFICQGSGWSTRGGGTTQYVVADFYVDGTEVYRQDTTNPAVGNSYW